MTKAGKRTNREELEIAIAEQIETYAQKRNVLGISDVESGVRVMYPTTIYNLSGDDTSGIAGLLYPNGDYILTQPPTKTQKYWDFEETKTYEKTAEGRVQGNSWTEGEVIWDGSVGGSIEPLSEEIHESQPVHKRNFDASLGGDWSTTGELWRALERGTGMHRGQTPGKIHLHHLGGDRRSAMGDAA